MKPGDKKDCPRCKGVALDITPLKDHDPSIAVFACQACGFAFKIDNKQFLDGPDELRDFFRGATEGNKTIMGILGGKKMEPATRAMVLASLLEYGTQMWFDGLKQGLLLGVIQDGKIQHGQGSSATEPAERGSPADAGSPTVNT